MSNYKPQEFAEIIGVSVKTLQRWDRDGKLIAYRSITNRRYYTDEHLLKCKEGKRTCLEHIKQK
jgi:DNA-binding transcriptional MerR regulator